MTKYDAMMLSLYLLVIAMGAVMMSHGSLVGPLQIFLGAVFFGFRMRLIFGKR